MQRWALFFVALAYGCGSDDSTTATTATDSGASDSVATDTATMDTGVVGCGPGPYVTINAQVRSVTASGVNPAKGVTISSDACPGVTFAKFVDGRIISTVTKGAATFYRIDAPDMIGDSLGELKFDADITFPGFVSLWKKADLLALVPDIDTKPYAAIPGVLPEVMSGPCSDNSGVTFSIPEVPAATVQYYEPAGKPVPGGPLPKDGFALITGIPDKSIFTVKGEKSGCALKLGGPNYTGRFRAETGRLSYIEINITNP